MPEVYGRHLLSMLITTQMTKKKSGKKSLNKNFKTL